MVVVFAILFFIFLYLTMKIVEEHLTNKKFKVGYYFDTYELEFHATDSYKKLETYKIEANKDGYIVVQNRTDGVRGDITEFKISDLLYRTDKIIIKNENGEEVETLHKLDPLDY